MLKKENILNQLNFVRQCREYGISLWQCPNFLFIIIGFVAILAILAAYFTAVFFEKDPLFIIVITASVSIIILIIGWAIINSFDKLAQANKMKTEFVGIVSHQLRAPLSNIKWSMNSLLKNTEGNLDVKQIEYLNLIRTNNERMIKLVNDLLNVSHIEQGRLNLNPSRFSLKDLTEEAIKDFSIIAKANNVSLEAEFEKNLAPALADPSYVSLILQNLIDNAIRYIEKDGCVKIRLESGGNKIKCTIEDNGAGIPAAEQKYIFQKFFRSENIMKRRTQGTGLGLYIAKSIIELSGGAIGFQSQEGRGSTFWFTLPIK